VSEEAGWVDGRPVNLLSRDQVNNLGANIFPDTIELGVIDSMETLDRYLPTGLWKGVVRKSDL